MSEIMVSIICIAYNHENYIADALESFLEQKTSFNFEIIVHDDASNDKTAEIIKSYEIKYPNIIKTILQSENQYSKDIKICMLSAARAKGKYIAHCEGDDYWIDTSKLQKQVEFMESHPDCSACVHANELVSESTKEIISYYRPSNHSRYFTIEEIILGGGGIFSTNSILEKSEFCRNRPEFYMKSKVGDYPMLIHLALVGRIFYIDEVMSAYRVNSLGSWSQKIQANKKFLNEHLENTFDTLERINEYTNFKYNEAISRRKLHVLLLRGDYNNILKGNLRSIYLRMKLRTKIYYFVKCKFPGLLRILKRLKGNENYANRNE